MPLPEKFYNMYDNEVTLEQLCVQEPHWAANRIRTLANEIDMLRNAQPKDSADAKSCTHNRTMPINSFSGLYECLECGNLLRR